MEKPTKFDDHYECEECGLFSRNAFLFDYRSDRDKTLCWKCCEEGTMDDQRVFYQCFKDGLAKGALYTSYDEAWMGLHALQPNSVDWAFKHEGWRIREVNVDSVPIIKAQP